MDIFVAYVLPTQPDKRCPLCCLWIKICWQYFNVVSTWLHAVLQL